MLDLWTASMKNWDEDPEADGIEATIAPRDKDDKMQYAVGVVNAKAYERNLNTSTYKYEKGELVRMVEYFNNKRPIWISRRPCAIGI